MMIQITGSSSSKIDLDLLFDESSDYYCLEQVCNLCKVIDRLYGRSLAKKFFSHYIKSDIIDLPPSVNSKA